MLDYVYYVTNYYIYTTFCVFPALPFYLHQDLWVCESQRKQSQPYSVYHYKSPTQTIPE